MNPYYYWFFAIYHIYAKCSKSQDFHIFAAGLFSFLVFDIIYVISDYILAKTGYPYFWIEPYYKMFLLISAILIINAYLFFYKKKYLKLYEKYNMIKNNRKDTLAIIFSIFVFLGTLYCVVYIQAKKNDKCFQTSFHYEQTGKEILSQKLKSN